MSLRSIPLLDYAAANTAHGVYCYQLLQFCLANSELCFLNSDPESDLRVFKSKLRLLFLKQSVDVFRISIFGMDWPCLRHSVCVLGIALALLTAVSFLLDMRMLTLHCRSWLNESLAVCLCTPPPLFPPSLFHRYSEDYTPPP